MAADRRWRRVVFAAECDEDGNCPICKDMDFADCPHPGPTQDDEFDYRERGGVLQARAKKNPADQGGAG